MGTGVLPIVIDPGKREEGGEGGDARKMEKERGKLRRGWRERVEKRGSGE